MTEPKKYKIDISTKAQSDLYRIFEYIAFELNSTPSARKTIKRLERNILSLDQLPKRYRKYNKEPWLNKGLRMLVVDNYCVFYIVDDHTYCVEIIRVVFGKKDIDMVLENT